MVAVIFGAGILAATIVFAALDIFGHLPGSNGWKRLWLEESERHDETRKKLEDAEKILESFAKKVEKWRE